MIQCWKQWDCTHVVINRDIVVFIVKTVVISASLFFAQFSLEICSQHFIRNYTQREVLATKIGLESYLNHSSHDSSLHIYIPLYLIERVCLLISLLMLRRFACIWSISFSFWFWKYTCIWTLIFLWHSLIFFSSWWMNAFITSAFLNWTLKRAMLLRFPSHIPTCPVSACRPWPNWSASPQLQQNLSWATNCPTITLMSRTQHELPSLTSPSAPHHQKSVFLCYLFLGRLNRRKASLYILLCTIFNVHTRNF